MRLLMPLLLIISACGREDPATKAVTTAAQPSTSVQGDKGEKGEPGAPGQAGPAGKDGAAGPKGDKGDQGPAAKDGSVGQPGPQGDPVDPNEWLDPITEALWLIGGPEAEYLLKLQNPCSGAFRLGTLTEVKTAVAHGLAVVSAHLGGAPSLWSGTTIQSVGVTYYQLVDSSGTDRFNYFPQGSPGVVCLKN